MKCIENTTCKRFILPGLIGKIKTMITMQRKTHIIVILDYAEQSVTLRIKQGTSKCSSLNEAKLFSIQIKYFFSACSKIDIKSFIR